MEFQISHQPAFAALTVKMNAGEKFKAEAGAMLSMTSNVRLEAKASGKGVFGSLKAAIGGESFFASLYTAESDGAEIIFAPPLSGDIVRVDLNSNTIYCEGGAYLAGAVDLEISTKGSFKGWVAGEGLFLQKISGTGPVFLSSYGGIIEREIKPNQNFIVDTGHLVAFEETLDYSIKKAAKGIFSTFASGEGLVAEFSGSGKVWMQTRNLPAFVGLLEKMLPSRG
jgi:uncharacterized protein (TIGR00266 family)